MIGKEEEQNDISPMFSEAIKIEEVGKYGKFVNFKERVYVDAKGKIIHDNPPNFEVPYILNKFSSNKFKVEKLTLKMRYDAVCRMVSYVQKQIDLEIKIKFEKKIFYARERLEKKKNFQQLQELKIKLWHDLERESEKNSMPI